VPCNKHGPVRRRILVAVTMKPLMALSVDTGTKHVVSYFLSVDGRCKLTLVIAERYGDEKDQPIAQASRSKSLSPPAARRNSIRRKQGAAV